MTSHARRYGPHPLVFVFIGGLLFWIFVIWLLTVLIP